MPTLKKNLSLNVGDRVYFKQTRYRQMITEVGDTGGHRDINELNKLKEESVIFYDASKMDYPVVPKNFELFGEFADYNKFTESLKNLFETDRKTKAYVRVIYSDGSIVAGYVKGFSEHGVLGLDDMVVAGLDAVKYVIFIKQ